jgi:hypothetical protein
MTWQTVRWVDGRNLAPDYEMNDQGVLRRRSSVPGHPAGKRKLPCRKGNSWSHFLKEVGGWKEKTVKCDNVFRTLFPGRPLPDWGEVRKEAERYNQQLYKNASQSAVRRRAADAKRKDLGRSGAYNPEHFVTAYWSDIKPGLGRSVNRWSPEFDPMSRGCGWEFEGAKKEN